MMTNIKLDKVLFEILKKNINTACKIFFHFLTFFFYFALCFFSDLLEKKRNPIKIIINELHEVKTNSVKNQKTIGKMQKVAEQTRTSKIN